MNLQVESHVIKQTFLIVPRETGPENLRSGLVLTTSKYNFTRILCGKKQVMVASVRSCQVLFPEPRYQLSDYGNRHLPRKV